MSIFLGTENIKCIFKHAIKKKEKKRETKLFFPWGVRSFFLFSFSADDS